MSGYKTLLMDADDTVFDFHKAERQAFNEMAAQMGLDCDDALYARYSEINQRCWKLLEQGRITKSELHTARFAEWLRESGQAGDPARMNECYMAKLSTFAILFDDSEEVLEALSEHCRIYFITNGTAMVQRGRFARASVMRYIDDFFVSGEIGYEKPDRRYFEAVIEKISDFDAESTLVVGDSPSSDIAGANRMGLDCCWVNRRGCTLPDHVQASFEVPDLKTLCEIIGKEN